MITPMITWATFLSGLLGSVVAGTVTFAAAAWTIRANRKTDYERGLKQDATRDLARRREVVAEVVAALSALESEIRWMPFLRGRTGAAFLRVTMLFYLSERPHHPLVAKWVLDRQDHLNAAAARWERWWWVLFRNRREATQVSQFVAETVSTLVLWSTGELADSDFDLPADQLPSGVAKNRRDAA